MAFLKLPGSLLWLLVVLLVSLPVSISLPFVVFHGVNDDCKGVRNFVQRLSSLSGSPGYCIEIGNGKIASIFTPMDIQASIACRKVKEMKQLSGGYNIVGMSQGNLVARGVIEFCDGAPPGVNLESSFFNGHASFIFYGAGRKPSSVKNYVSLGGPHAGIAALPKCSGFVCSLLKRLLKKKIYSKAVQDVLGPSGYVRLPEQIPKYLEGCRYLPRLNNEKPNAKNPNYKIRFSSLQNLVLIMFESDTTLVPRETSWFGYYPDGARHPVLFPQLTRLYKEDWIGLKTLDDARKVHYLSVPGNHLQITNLAVRKYVVPYLQNKPSVLVENDESPEKVVYDGSSSYDWPPFVIDRLKELLRY